MSWWSSPNKEPKEGEEASEGTSPTKSGGMFSGAMSYMKGLVGMDSLKAEDGGGVNKLDIDETQRKGLFSQLSSYIGKDVTSMISLPVWIFEPASFLQVMSEPLQYADLLNKAANSADLLDRLVYVAAFNCALYCTAIRTRKPFNPILGETFEIVQPGDGFKFIAEQVSHHPPIGVSHTDAKLYNLQLETNLKSKFYGNSSEVLISGTNQLDLKKTGDHITWGHIVTCCHNIIIGSLWLDHYGDLTIENHTTGERCVMKFQKAGWLGVGRYGVTGEVLDKNGNVKIKLNGKWNTSLMASRDGGEQYCVWEASNEVPDNKFMFPKFVMEQVINLNPELESILPANDSRLRADRRALEAGDYDAASKAKHEMEEKQRAQRREREAANEHWEPKYFKQVRDKTGIDVWEFNGKYWEERAERVRERSK